MQSDMDMSKKVSKEYLKHRKRLLNYTNEDMNLSLENDEQVYIALFDIPMKSGIVGFQTQSLALVFGLNVHIYHGSGSVVVDLEKNSDVMKAMQSVLKSGHQVLSKMQLMTDIDFYNCDNVRVYLKTRKGIFFKELSDKEDKINKFLQMLMKHVMTEIVKTGELNFDKL